MKITVTNPRRNNEKSKLQSLPSRILLSCWTFQLVFVLMPWRHVEHLIKVFLLVKIHLMSELHKSQERCSASYSFLFPCIDLLGPLLCHRQPLQVAAGVQPRGGGCLPRQKAPGGPAPHLLHLWQRLSVHADWWVGCFVHFFRTEP